MSVKTMVDAINDGLREAMRKDDTILVLGEDVAVDGGVFRVTQGLLDEFGSSLPVFVNRKVDHFTNEKPTTLAK